MAPASHDGIADGLIEWAAAHPRVRALWIEAGTAGELRRPYGGLRAHIAIDEPDFPAVTAEIARGIAALPGSRVAASADVPRFAREFSIEFRGLPFTLTAEQSYLLAKRPRAEVVPLVDKTGHLPHVLDYSLRGKQGIRTADRR